MLAIDRLRRVAQGQPTPDDLEWLSGRLGAYLDSPERGLEHALWLDCAPGEQPWWQVERRQQRDGLLLRLWRERYFRLSAWDAAEAILTASTRYAASAWLHQRDKATPPADATAALLWRLMKLGVRLPTTRRRIYEILNTADRSALY